MVHIPLSATEIDKLHEDASGQMDYLIGLFELITSKAGIKWEEINSFDQYPIVSKATSRYLMHKAIETDRRLSVDAMPGGAWMNFGFSHNASTLIDDWVVSFDETKIKFNAAKAAKDFTAKRAVEVMCHT